jgi:NitT/TauT family transport system permease protein
VRATLGQQTLSLATLAVLVIAWEGLAWGLAIPAFALPRPSRIAVLLVTRWDLFARHLLYTSQEIMVGFLASVAVGIPVAIGIVYSRVFERVSYTLIVASQAVPKTALAPLFVLWFGYGFTSKVAVAFLIAFFPIVVNTVIGMRSVEPEMLYLARSLGASAWQVFVKIRLPRALPSVFGGLKVAVTLAVVGAIVGEYIGANAGLGYIQLVASAGLDTSMVFGVIVVLSLLGVVLFNLVSLVERVVIRWRPGEAQIEAARETM